MAGEIASSPDREARTAGRRSGDAHHDEFLVALGERIRTVRARRGMSRKVLSRQSGVSERYIAQLESGQGNISILLLRQLSQAMSVPLGDLIAEGPEKPIEISLILQLLNRLPESDLAAARDLLNEKFGMAAGAGRRGRIALIGLRGAGKSTLGQALAERIDCPFIELGREVERMAGTSMGEIFSLYGQVGYRRFERRCLERVVEENERAVIATGGSLVAEPGTFELLLSSCFTIWVSASPAEHMSRVIAQGDRRPMEDNKEAMADLELILSRRAPLYAEAHGKIDTSGRGVAESLSSLLEVVGQSSSPNSPRG